MPVPMPEKSNETIVKRRTHFKYYHLHDKTIIGNDLNGLGNDSHYRNNNIK